MRRRHHIPLMPFMFCEKPCRKWRHLSSSKNENKRCQRACASKFNEPHVRQYTYQYTTCRDFCIYFLDFLTFFLQIPLLNVASKNLLKYVHVFQEFFKLKRSTFFKICLKTETRIFVKKLCPKFLSLLSTKKSQVLKKNTHVKLISYFIECSFPVQSKGIQQRNVKKMLVT